MEYRQDGFILLTLIVGDVFEKQIKLELLWSKNN